MADHDLADYEEVPQGVSSIALVSTAYFKDFLLRDELNQAIQDVQFEHPSYVQQLTIPRAILGVDILCQAKSGTGKTAVFVLSTLHQLTPIAKETSIVVIVHTKELALQVKHEFLRFTAHFKDVTVEDFYGGKSVDEDIKRLESGCPTIYIGTPGRTLDLLNRRVLYFRHVKYFVIDEVDECIGDLSMRYSIQKIFMKTPLHKQTLMFTATLNDEVKADCFKFLRNPHVVSVDEERKLTLHGLTQQYITVTEDDKLKTLEDLIDNTEFAQLVIFVRDKRRAMWLTRQLKSKGFPAIDIHAGMSTEERMARFKRFKDVKERILVTTNLMARGIDVQDVNVVINYDMPENADTYLHRVGRAGRFETKGSAISLVENASDVTVLNDIQARFEVSIKNLSESK